MPKERPHSTYLGSSDAPPIIGVPSYGRTTIDVWEEKTGGGVEPAETSAMSWGSRLEPLIIADYEAKTGRTVDRRRRQRFHPDYPFIGCREDGRSGDRLVEAKFTPWGEYGEPADGEEGLPPYVRVQVKHQMLVTGHKIVDVPVLVKGYDLRVFTVEADPAYQADLLDEEVEWWNAYVVPRIPPPPEDAESYGRFLSRRYPRDDETTMTATAELVAVMRDLQMARLAKGQATTREEDIIIALKEVMGTAAVLEAEGVGRITWRGYDVTKVKWDLVAAGYRKAIEHELREVAAGRLAETLLPDYPDLDAIVTLYTRKEPRRPFVPKFEAEPVATPQDGGSFDAE